MGGHSLEWWLSPPKDDEATKQHPKEPVGLDLFVNVIPLLQIYMLEFVYTSKFHDLSHSQSLALTEMSHNTFIFRFFFFVPIHQHTKRKREITAEKVNCLIHFPVAVCLSRLPIPCA